jgi:hypothetical protein
MTGGCAPGAAEVIGPMDVLAFWRAAGPDKWFERSAAFDAEIKHRFFSVWRAAEEGKLAHWEETPEGALGLVIVLDQFPRNMLRGERRTYATDALARAVADRAIARGFDRQVSLPERQFFYLPFMPRRIWPIRSGAWSWRAPTAMMSSRNMPSIMPRSSAASAVSRTAMRRWVAPRAPTSRPSSTAAALLAERMRSPRRAALNTFAAPLTRDGT